MKHRVPNCGLCKRVKLRQIHANKAYLRTLLEANLSKKELEAFTMMDLAAVA